MEKKSKLTIKHFYGEEELKKIKVSPTGFPLYVMVRYKRVKSIFASRVGIRFANSRSQNDFELRHYPEVAKSIMQEETKYIENVREYFEEFLGVEFKPSVLTNPVLEYQCWQKVEDFFNSLPVIYSIEKVLSNKSWACLKLLNAAGPMVLMDALKDLNVDVFEELMELDNNRELFNYYQLFKSIGDEEVNRLEFRIMDFGDDSNTREFKSWIDQKFDKEIKSIDLSIQYHKGHAQ